MCIGSPFPKGGAFYEGRKKRQWKLQEGKRESQISRNYLVKAVRILTVLLLANWKERNQDLRQQASISLQLFPGRSWEVCARSLDSFFSFFFSSQTTSDQSEKAHIVFAVAISYSLNELSPTDIQKKNRIIESCKSWRIKTLISMMSYLHSFFFWTLLFFFLVKGKATITSWIFNTFRNKFLQAKARRTFYSNKILWIKIHQMSGIQ